MPTICPRLKQEVGHPWLFLNCFLNHLPVLQHRHWNPICLCLACHYLLSGPCMALACPSFLQSQNDVVLLLSRVTVEHNLFTTQCLENKVWSLQLSHILYPLYLQKQQAFWLKSSTCGHVHGSPSAVDMLHLASSSFREHLPTALPWHPKLSLSELSP